MRDTSNVEEVFRVIESLRSELARLRQVERDYLKLSEEMRSLLARVERERAAATRGEAVFYFNLDTGHSTDYSASNLEEFIRVLEIVPVQSLEFHLNRGDFEAWLKFIGSEELSLTFGALRNENLSGEALRSRLLELVHSLSSVQGGTIDLS